MARLTITLPDELHRALKQAAVRRGRTIGEVIEESLALYGVKTEEAARDLVARARGRSGLSEGKALSLSLRETRASRR